MKNTRSVIGDLCEILIGFMRIKVKFDRAFEEWERKGEFDFPLMDELEVSLYHLKNKTHLALRENTAGGERFLEKADLFDLMIGSIFHETLHLKEFIYTLESYAPRYRSFAKKLKGRKFQAYPADFLRHSMEIVSEAETSLPRKAREVKNLFEDSLALLEDIIKKHRGNNRVIRTLFTSAELFNRVYGSEGLGALYEKVYKNGPAEGYFQAGSSFVKEGFFDLGLDAFEKALNCSANSPGGDSVREGIKKRCELLAKKHPELSDKTERLLSGTGRAA